MDMEGLKELKRLAEAATPGPWIAVNYGNYDGTQEHWYLDTTAAQADIVDDRDGTIDPNHSDDGRGERDMKFIAAANPTTVLALIAECERLKAENERVRVEIVGSLTHAGICMLAEGATSEGEIPSAVARLARERDEARTAHQQELERHRKTFTQLEQAKREIAQLKGVGQ